MLAVLLGMELYPYLDYNRQGGVCDTDPNKTRAT